MEVTLKQIINSVYVYDIMHREKPRFIYLGHNEYITVLENILSDYVNIIKNDIITVCGIEVIEVCRSNHIHVV